MRGLEKLTKILYIFLSNIIFRIYFIVILMMGMLFFIIISNLNYREYISVFGVVVAGIAIFGSIYIEKYAFNILKLQITALEYFTKDLNELVSRSENKEVAVKEIAISLTYLFNLKERNYLTKISLVFFSVALALLDYYLPWILLNYSIICIVTLALIIIKELIVEFRIKKGWFGTNKIEAKALIEFLISNSDDIDFTDGNGKLKRVLFPESTPSKEVAKPVDGGISV